MAISFPICPLMAIETRKIRQLPEFSANWADLWARETIAGRIFAAEIADTFDARIKNDYAMERFPLKKNPNRPTKYSPKPPSHSGGKSLQARQSSILNLAKFDRDSEADK